MTAQHTPGPWVPVLQNASSINAVPHRVHGFVAQVLGGYAAAPMVAHAFGKTADEAAANARLIAAVTELLAAAEAWEAAEEARNDCAECLNEGPWEHCGPCSEPFGSAIELRRAAIAKATGAA
jgi:hypothetical protein